MTQLADTHAHLFWDSFKEDFGEVLKRCLENDVTTILNVGVDVDLSQKALDQLPQIEKSGITAYSSIAIHPEDAIRYAGKEEQMKIDVQKLEAIYNSNPEKVVAVGECGLDYGYFTHEGYLPEGISIEQAKDLQLKLFKLQIDLAKKLNLPLLLHVRDDRSHNPENTECWDKVIEMTKDHFGINHCYSGLQPTTHNLQPNFLVSFAGNVTYKKNEYLREAVKKLPLEKIVLETDCPFLPPQSIRGQRNEPSSVKEIAKLIAELKGISFEEVADQTTNNFLKLIKN